MDKPHPTSPISTSIFINYSIYTNGTPTPIYPSNINFSLMLNLTTWKTSMMNSKQIHKRHNTRNIE